MPKGFGPPAKERHPAQQEEFRVLRGTLGLGRIDGQQVRLRPGDCYRLAAGVYHLPVNVGDGEVEFEATLTPGLDAASMFGELYTTTKAYRGLDQFARVMLIFRHYRKTISFPLQVRFVMAVIAALASVMGARRERLATSPAPSDGSDQ